MNYWLTTQWPPREGSDNEGPYWIYLPADGRQIAGKDIKPGDHVLIYQSRTGRTKLDNRKNPIKNQIGREGVIAIEEVQKDLKEDLKSKPDLYTNGTSILWGWYAETSTLSENGFISREKVNQILGYKKNNPLRGFGDLKSGLKKLNEQQYTELVDQFKKKSKKNPIVDKLLNSYKKKSRGRRGRGESKKHRLLKEYIANNPSKVLGEEGLKTIKLEYSFPTGDRADIVIEDQFGRIIGLEVEVSVGDNQLEGILQAIKYRFMLALMKGLKYIYTRSFLVSYNLSNDIKKICKEYDVEYFEIDYSEVKIWAKRNIYKVVKV